MRLDLGVLFKGAEIHIWNIIILIRLCMFDLTTSPAE